MKADVSASSRPPVFVLGAGGCNSLGVVRAFGRRGIPVCIIDSSNPLEHMLYRYGRFLRSPPLVPGDASVADFLAVRAQADGQRPVLICTNDR